MFFIGIGLLIAGAVFIIGGLQAIAGGYADNGAALGIIIGGIFLLGAWTALRPKSKPAFTIDIFDKRK